MIHRICLLTILGCVTAACCQSPTPAIFPPSKPMVSVVAKPVEAAPVVQPEPKASPETERIIAVYFANKEAIDAIWTADEESGMTMKEAVYEWEKRQLAKPAAPPVLHAFIVVECLNPACAKHGHFFAATEELQRRGWGDFVTVYSTKTDSPAIDALGMGGDVYPYVVLTADGKEVDGLVGEKSAKELGDWLNEQAKDRKGVWGNSSGLLTSSAEQNATTSAEVQPVLSAGNSQEKLDSSKEPVLSAVVVSGGDWCSYCVKLKRDKPAIEAETGAHLRIIDSDSAEAKPYGVRSLPTTIILRDGTEVGREVGYGGRGPFVRFLVAVKAKGGRWE